MPALSLLSSALSSSGGGGGGEGKEEGTGALLASVKLGEDGLRFTYN